MLVIENVASFKQGRTVVQSMGSFTMKHNIYFIENLHRLFLTLNDLCLYILSILGCIKHSITKVHALIIESHR